MAETEIDKLTRRIAENAHEANIYRRERDKAEALVEDLKTENQHLRDVLRQIHDFNKYWMDRDRPLILVASETCAMAANALGIIT